MAETNACNPLNACCLPPPARPEVTNASSPIDQYVRVVHNPTLRGYSRQTLHNVVETSNAFRQLTDQCRTGSHRILGRGPIADLLTLPCIAGGMTQGMATGLLSLGGRVGDTLPLRATKFAEILDAGTSGAAFIEELLQGMYKMIREKPPSWLAEHRPRLIALRDELRRIQSLYRNQKQSEAQARFEEFVMIVKGALSGERAAVDQFFSEEMGRKRQQPRRQKIR